MGKWIQALIYFVLRRLLHRRYDVEVLGLEKLESLEGPVLVLPNHPAYVDPPIVLSHLRCGKSLRPLVFTDTYRSPLFYPLMNVIDAYEVPNLKSHSRDAHAKTTQLIEQVSGELNQGESFLIYPSGRLQRQGYEIVGGARIAYELLERADDKVNVVLIRTRGLWGSRFGCAQEGDVPDLGRNALASLLWILAGLIFFLPKRKVILEVHPVDRSDLPMESKTALNHYLESFYNADGGEAAKYVPYSYLFGPRDFDYESVKRKGSVDLGEVPESTIQGVHEILEQRLDRKLEDREKEPGTTLDLLGLDSLERMDLALELERQFGFRSDHVPATVGELCLLAAGKATTDEEPLKVPDGWDDEKKPSTNHPEVLAETIAEAFVRRALQSANHTAVADTLSGALSYRKLLVGATLLSKRIAKLEGNSVGIMLPASVAADSVVLAALMAGKLPVMLNWTTGPAGLRHATEKLEVSHVVTSKRFMDRLGIDLDGVEMFYLEDVREGISTWEKLQTLIATYVAPNSFLQSIPQPNPDDPAVILFTSGSESQPKAVPLSHRNLIADMRGGIDHMDFHRSDTLLGFLPPFHSFGLTAAALMPLLSGIRVVHHADPTDSRMLARIIAAYKPTFTFTTPTFLQYIVSSSEPGELNSLRLVMVGAEKCPASLFEQTMKILPELDLLEGYGITECSPVVSGNKPGHNKPGTIGLPIHCVETMVVHPETHQPLSQGETGLLLIRGASVFNGYYKYDAPQPFLEVAGHRWYNSGDLVSKDEDGFIQFRGRLKRFLKIGGEMVSLPALEAPFSEKYPADEEGPQVAVEGVEQDGGRCIVLFTTQEITLREANDLLKKAGFQGIMRLDEVRQVEAIPVLGTGKTNYRELRSWIESESEMVAES